MTDKNAYVSAVLDTAERWIRSRIDPKARIERWMCRDMGPKIMALKIRCRGSVRTIMADMTPNDTPKLRANGILRNVYNHVKEDVERTWI